ncbi:MAG: tRNA-dihydrouridine synthase, partial [Verrucomicrobiota bacterium]
AVHGRTRSMGYSGEANWDVIQQCVESVDLPVIGNGDLQSGADVRCRLATTGVDGVMIGRAAMGYPWIFREAREFLAGSEALSRVTLADRWAFMARHCRMAWEYGRYGDERRTMQAMRGRLMAYSKGLRGGRLLRQRFGSVSSLAELDDLAAEYLAGGFEPPHTVPEHERAVSA